MELKSSCFSFRMLEGNDLITKFYTGLPSWSMFVYVFTFVSRDLNPHGNHALCLEDQFFLALLKLRLDLLMEDIAHRFSVSVSTASCIFSKWVDILYTRLHFLIAWPQKEILCKTCLLLLASYIQVVYVSLTVLKYLSKHQIHSLPVQLLTRTTRNITR